MTRTEPAEPNYSEPKEILQQGDIFRVNLVGPGADTEQRIFRSADGRHGSVVFEEDCDYRVFSRNELDTLLSQGGGTSLHTTPFTQTPDGAHEMVVSEAQLHSYFFLASHTCDISGEDKKPFPWAIILPIVTLARQCQREKIPFNNKEILTPQELVFKYSDMGERLEGITEFEYMERFWQILEDWAKQEANRKVKEKVGRIRNFLKKLGQVESLHFLPPDSVFTIPESTIDFTTIYTIPRERLVAIQEQRISCLGTKMLADFTQRFSHFFQRVAFETSPSPGSHRG